jgi:hypothetical protein
MMDRTGKLFLRRLARPALRGRLEALESRCLLSIAPADGFLPPVSDVEIVESPPFEEWSPASGEEWIEPLPAWDEPPSIPPMEPEGSAGVGGMIDIDQPEEPYFDASPELAPESEAEDVLQMLSSLRYRPDEFDSEASLPNDDRETEEEFNAPLLEGAETRRDDAEGGPEGGLIALAVDEAFAGDAAGEQPPASSGESLLEITVQMDTAHGKFQAFEVSTAEEPAPAPPSQEPGAPDDAEKAEESVSPARDESAPTERAPGDGADEAPQDAEARAEEDHSNSEDVAAVDAATDPSLGAPDEESRPSWPTTVALAMVVGGYHALRMRQADDSAGKITAALRARRLRSSRSPCRDP